MADITAAAAGISAAVDITAVAIMGAIGAYIRITSPIILSRATAVGSVCASCVMVIG